MDLVQSIFHDKCNYLDHEQASVLEHLIALRDAANNTDEAVRLFEKYDEDKSGALDKNELRNVLNDFGMNIPDEKLNDFILLYDVDGAGLIELPEFLSFIKSQQQEAHMRIRDMTENMGMALSSIPGIKYAPPREGVLRLEVVDSFVKKANYQVISITDQSNLTSVAKDTGDVSRLMSYGVQNSRLRLSEAISIFNTMIKEGGEKISTICKLLPQIETAVEVRSFISRITKNDRVHMGRIKITMGNALRPLLGIPNGFYMLDLSKEMDRLCLSRLLELGGTYKYHGMLNSKLGFGVVGDTSQRGNWSCFRNEMWNDENVSISTQLFTPMPRKGKLHFDFSWAKRPALDEVVMTDAKFLKTMVNLALVSDADDINAINRLNLMKKEAKKALPGIGTTVYETPLEEAMRTALRMSEFYDDLLNRDVLYIEATKEEEMSILFNGSAPQSRISTAELAPAIEVETSQKVRYQEPEYLDIHQADTIRRDSKTATEHVTSTSTEDEDDVKSGSYLSQMKFVMNELLTSDLVSPQAKASRLIEAMDECFGLHFIRSRHLAILLERFPKECLMDKVPIFGSYRVEIVVSFFPRLFDIHNFELIMRVLDANEKASIFCRIGRLNIMNPMKPEGGYELNMGLYEERQCAKILVTLSVIEPGDNFIGGRFRWDREQDFIPGWEVFYF